MQISCMSDLIRSRKMLKNAPALAIGDVDKAENEPRKNSGAKVSLLTTRQHRRSLEQGEGCVCANAGEAGRHRVAL